MNACLEHNLIPPSTSDLYVWWWHVGDLMESFLTEARARSICVLYHSHLAML